MNTKVYHEDIVKRAKFMLENIGASFGVYSPAAGFDFIRENVARFINKRDDSGEINKVTKNDIILTDGTSKGIHLLL